MASNVDICNIGLSLIGARAQISSITPPDGTVEAGLCARFLPIARKELIETGAWAFARRRAHLAEVNNESDVWRYAYAVPSGMSNALRVLSRTYLLQVGISWPMVYEPNSQMNWALVDDLFKERGSTEFDIENGVLYTNEPDAVLLYTVDVTDPTKFSAMFTTALGMLMASYLAGPIIKGKEGASAMQAWRQAAMQESGRAEVSDANSTNQRAEHVPDFMRARL